jgi:hypothetical protein
MYTEAYKQEKQEKHSKQHSQKGGFYFLERKEQSIRKEKFCFWYLLEPEKRYVLSVGSNCRYLISIGLCIKN